MGRSARRRRRSLATRHAERFGERMLHGRATLQIMGRVGGRTERREGVGGERMHAHTPR